MKHYASWQWWFVVLVGTSVCGTACASFLLVFDGWADALAIYVATALMSVVLLSRLAGQWEQGEQTPVGAEAQPPRRPAWLREWPGPARRAPCPEEAVSPAALGKMTATD